MLLPGILTAEGLPHSLRVIASIPPIFIMAGLGFVLLYELIIDFIGEKISYLKESGFSKILVLSCLGLLVYSFIYAQYNKYFFTWARNNETKGSFTEDFVKVGEYLNSQPNEAQKYVIVNESGVLAKGLPMPAQTPMFIEKTKNEKPNTIYLKPERMEEIKIEGNTVIVTMKLEERIIFDLISTFPEGEPKREQGLWVFKNY